MQSLGKIKCHIFYTRQQIKGKHTIEIQEVDISQSITEVSRPGSDGLQKPFGNILLVCQMKRLWSGTNIQYDSMKQKHNL